MLAERARAVRANALRQPNGRSGVFGDVAPRYMQPLTRHVTGPDSPTRSKRKPGFGSTEVSRIDSYHRSLGIRGPVGPARRMGSARAVGSGGGSSSSGGGRVDVADASEVLHRVRGRSAEPVRASSAVRASPSPGRGYTDDDIPAALRRRGVRSTSVEAGERDGAAWMDRPVSDRRR